MTAGPPVVDRVIAVVTEIAGANRTPGRPGPDTPLGEDGFWLDSVDFLELVLACEETFGVEFDAEADLTTGTLQTVGSLAATIAAKLP